MQVKAAASSMAAFLFYYCPQCLSKSARRRFDIICQDQTGTRINNSTAQQLLPFLPDKIIALQFKQHIECGQ